MDEVCDLLPSSYKDECENFVNKYGKDAVEFLLSYAAPHTICTLLHLCLFQESPVMSKRPSHPSLHPNLSCLLHICSGQLPLNPSVLLSQSFFLTLSRPAVETIPSDCDTCRTLAALTRVQLGSNATETETSGFLGSVCLLYPQAVPKVAPYRCL